MNAHEEIEFSRMISALTEAQNKLKNSFRIEHDVIKWNYEKCKEDGDQEQSLWWRTLMIASCKDHDYEDTFEEDGTFLGCICKNCTANSEEDEEENVKIVVEKSCESCVFRGGIESDSLFCNHPTIDTLEEIQMDEWMNKYFEDSKNCIHWKGKIC